jgi:hypothetical protein
VLEIDTHLIAGTLFNTARFICPLEHNGGNATAPQDA